MKFWLRKLKPKTNVSVTKYIFFVFQKKIFFEALGRVWGSEGWVEGLAFFFWSSGWVWRCISFDKLSQREKISLVKRYLSTEWYRRLSTPERAEKQRLWVGCIAAGKTLEIRKWGNAHKAHTPCPPTIKRSLPVVGGQAKKN